MGALRQRGLSRTRPAGEIHAEMGPPWWCRSGAVCLVEARADQSMVPVMLPISRTLRSVCFGLSPAHFSQELGRQPRIADALLFPGWSPTASQVCSTDGRTDCDEVMIGSGA